MDDLESHLGGLPFKKSIGSYIGRTRAERFSERRRNFRRISTRNQFVGLVTDIKVNGLMAQVTLSIGDQRITSIITADPVWEMRLEDNQTVTALTKSIEMMIIRM